MQQVKWTHQGNRVRNQQLNNLNQNIVKNFQFFYWISRLTGLNCFRMPSKRTGTVRFNCQYFIASLVYIAYAMAISLLNPIKNLQFNFSGSIIVNVGFVTTILSEALQITTSITFDILNRNKIWRILTDLYDFDQQVNCWTLIENIWCVSIVFL